MNLLDRIRFWLAKPYISQVWINAYEIGKAAGKEIAHEEMKHIQSNWQPTTFKPTLIGARERAKLARFRRDNLRRIQ